ncbi:MAG: UDP-N-acetylglucosamine 1-carboxyvinyltransferase, partial [Acidimicrobiia bacterium]
MSKLIVEGGARLQGTVGVLGAKNAVLKEMVSALLAPGRHSLSNVPSILDVDLMCRVLEHMGCHVERVDHEIWLVVPDELDPVAPIELVRQMR